MSDKKSTSAEDLAAVYERERPKVEKAIGRVNVLVA